MIKITNSDGVMTWLTVSAVAAVRETDERGKTQPT